MNVIKVNASQQFKQCSVHRDEATSESKKNDYLIFIDNILTYTHKRRRIHTHTFSLIEDCVCFCVWVAETKSKQMENNHNNNDSGQIDRFEFYWIDTMKSYQVDRPFNTNRFE